MLKRENIKRMQVVGSILEGTIIMAWGYLLPFFHLLQKTLSPLLLNAQGPGNKSQEAGTIGRPKFWENAMRLLYNKQDYYNNCSNNIYFKRVTSLGREGFGGGLSEKAGKKRKQGWL